VVICCWSSKGGSGTTVVATALALMLGQRSPAGAVLADLCGDAPAVLGIAEPAGSLGLAGWLAAGGDVPADGLGRLEQSVAPGVHLLARGRGPLVASRAGELFAALDADPRPVIVDAGLAAPASAGAVIASAATVSLLVVRPCFLALRRAVDALIRPSAVVLVCEEGRALTADDVENALGVPVRAEVMVTPTVARAVDAGILATRLPRSLARELRDAA
jgi:hypothetical protein